MKKSKESEEYQPIVQEREAAVKAPPVEDSGGPSVVDADASAHSEAASSPRERTSTSEKDDEATPLSPEPTNSARLDHNSADAPEVPAAENGSSGSYVLQANRGMLGWSVIAFLIMGGVVGATAALLLRRTGEREPGNVERHSAKAHSHNHSLHNHSFTDHRGSDLVSNPDFQPTPSPVRRRKKLGKKAWVMMAFTPPHSEVGDILYGTLAVARSLQRLSRYPVVLLTNTTFMPDGTDLAKALLELDVHVRPVYPVQLSEGHLMNERWKYAFWKLQIWTLTEFDQLVWLDADTMVYRSMDWLFEREWMWAQKDDWFCTGGKEVCSGLMSLFPSMEDYNGMIGYSKVIAGHLFDGDQQLIREYFEHVKHKPINVLETSEAVFGQCLGRAQSLLLEEKPGIWDLPAFVHKSGGWGNSNLNSYPNICFTMDVHRQRYVVGTAVMNMCHYHPLAQHWRTVFCEAIEIMKMVVYQAEEFCSDAEYVYSWEADASFIGELQGWPEREIDDARKCSGGRSQADGGLGKELGVQQVLLKTAHGTFIVTNMKGGVGAFPNARDVDAFELLTNQDGTITFRDTFCRFLEASGGSLSTTTAQSDNTHFEADLGQLLFSLKNKVSGHYISARGDGHVDVAAGSPGPDQMFSIGSETAEAPAGYGTGYGAGGPQTDLGGDGNLPPEFANQR